MAFKKFKKRYHKKRTRRFTKPKEKKKYVAVMTRKYGSVNSPWPLIYRTKLVYDSYVSLSQTSPGSPLGYAFRLNSLYDPDYSGRGEYPMYFRQLCNQRGYAPYERYRVNACKVKIQCFPRTSTSTSANALIAFTAGRTIYPAKNIHELHSRPNTKITYVTGTGSQKVKNFNHYFKIAPMLGMKTGRESYQNTGDYNHSPSEVVFGLLYLCAIDPDSQATVDFHVTLEFYCDFYNLNETDVTVDEASDDISDGIVKGVTGTNIKFDLS